MVEVWVPYNETEYPILLPDPIDLRLASRVIIPDYEESGINEELKSKLEEFKSPKIYIDEYLSTYERRLIREHLKIENVSFIDNPEDAEVIVGITRQDPIMGYTGSITGYYYRIIRKDKDFLSNLYDEMISSEDIINDAISRFPPDKFGVTLVMDGAGRINKFFSGYGPDHWETSITQYKNDWEIKVDLSPIVISSLGGYPYDTGLKSFLKAFLKLIPKVDDDSILFFVGDGSLEMDYDPTRLLTLRKEDMDSLDDLIYLKAKSIIESFRGKIILQTGLSSTICKIIGIKAVNNVEKTLGRIPSRRKRMITVIEDLTNIYIP